MKTSIINALLITVLILSAAPSYAQSNPYQETLADWATTLEQHVDAQGRTDFIALSKDTSTLQRFVDAIAKVSPTTNPELFSTREQVLAFHINAYNALAMKGVIERGIPKHLNSFIRRASFFKFRKVVIGGEKTNLYDYENKVIRPLGEARLHYALNCMVVDCPRLPQTVFVAETLEQNLQTAAKEFFSKPKHIKIDDTKKRVYLSGIMKFYTEDYVASGKKQDLIAYVNQFRDQPIPENYKVKFLDYDWTINQSPPSES